MGAWHAGGLEGVLPGRTGIVQLKPQSHRTLVATNRIFSTGAVFTLREGVKWRSTQSNSLEPSRLRPSSPISLSVVKH